MRWFSHRRRTGGPHPENRSCKPPSACTAVTLSPLAATQWHRLLLRAAYGAYSRERFTMHCQWGWLNSSSFFCPWRPWALTFDLDIQTRARFLYSAPNRFIVLRLIVRKLSCKQTNRQTDNAEKHPPRSAMLRRWVKVLCCGGKMRWQIHVNLPAKYAFNKRLLQASHTCTCSV